jgi:tRNA1Val (adenine37-N6)-methyltransferase
LIYSKSHITRDTFYRGKVIVRQSRRGYRFSIDAPLLADFLPKRPHEEALEIGAGSGIVSILTLFQNKFAKIYSIELQRSLYRLAKRNARLNHMQHQLEVIRGDFNQKYKDFAGIPVIFSNPPYMKTGMGRLSPNQEIRLAKNELALNLADVLANSSEILAPHGNLYLILPYNRYAELESLAAKMGLYIGEWRPVCSYSDRNPERFLVQLSAQRTRTRKLERLVIFKSPGKYTDHLDRILAGEPNAF